MGKKKIQPNGYPQHLKKVLVNKYNSDREVRQQGMKLQELATEAGIDWQDALTTVKQLELEDAIYYQTVTHENAINVFPGPWEGITPTASTLSAYSHQPSWHNKAFATIKDHPLISLLVSIAAIGGLIIGILQLVWK
jgi:hypothetical protein